MNNSSELKQIYWIWADMLQRCRNPNHHAFKNYGARGIFVDKRWYEFNNFMLDMGNRPLNHSLDRIDNNNGYFPNNCRWANSQTQNINKRIYLPNKFNISGIEFRDSKFGLKYRARLRFNGKIVADKTTNDFFEACCFRKSAESKFLTQLKGNK